MGAPNFAGLAGANFNAIHGQSVRYGLWPNPTGVPATGVTLTSGAGAWGVLADLIAAKAIATDFWICGFDLDTVGIQLFDVEVTNAAAVVLSEFRAQQTVVVVTAVGEYSLSSLRIPVGPYPIYMVANSQVQARCGGAGALALNVSVYYATLL